MKYATRNKKGVELSINMLVIVALAVFALFLIIGFVIGGFSFFRDIFGGFTERSPEEVAQIKCQTAHTNWKNLGSPEIRNVPGDRWYKDLCADRYDIDFNKDGVKGVNADGTPKDSTEVSYQCTQYVSVDCSA
ncbi:TPA: hypothetical protein H1005_00115 [archaeon]|nr:hypothetical protein [Candidatus Naiadarchaeales archaeon SRR2090153.bin1042]